MRLYVPEEEDSDRPAAPWSDVMTTARRSQAEEVAEAQPSFERKQWAWQDGRLARLGGPLLAVVLALWLTAGVWGARPPAGIDTLGHLVLSEFSIDHIFAEWQLDGWQPRFNLGYEAFLFLGPGFYWAVGLVRLLSLGLFSAAGAFKVVVIASFVALPLAVAFLARSFGLSRRAAGIAAILALAVNSPFGIGLQGLFGVGVVLHQFGAIFLFLALGCILRLLADPGPRSSMFAAATLAALVISHARSVSVLAGILLVLFVAVLTARALPSLIVVQPGPWWYESGFITPGTREPRPKEEARLFSDRVVRHLLAAVALAFAFACFYLVPLLAHRDLRGPWVGWATPGFGGRLSQIWHGQLLFGPALALAVLAGWVFALVARQRLRPYGLALALTPLIYLAVAHWAVRQWPGHLFAQLPERSLGYLGVLAVLPLAALLAHVSRRWGWLGDAGALALAAALVVVSLGPSRDVARQLEDPIPQMHEAARQLRRLVPDHARFATERDYPDEIDRTGASNPYHWLAWASGRNTLNIFGIEYSPAAGPASEPDDFSDKAPEAVAESVSRLGVTHVVAVSDEWAERLGSSPRFTEVWRWSPLAIFAVSAGGGQPDPSALITFDAPGQARLVGAQPNHLAIQIEPDRATRATVPISWSPKWHALLDGEPVTLRKSSSGLIELDVPAGSARLILEFGPDWWDRLGGVITLATVFLLVRRRRRRRREDIAGPPAEVEGADMAAVSTPAVPPGAEDVTQPLPGTGGASPGQEGPVRDDDTPSRADRVAQALLGAVDVSPRSERVTARDHHRGDLPGVRRGDGHRTP